MTVESKVCVVCGKPCIAMCPSCLERVHCGYGFNNEACSLNHEAKCTGAASSRSVKRESSPPCDASPAPIPVPAVFCRIAKSPPNGKHVAPVTRKRGRR
jgi:hypothetical protein